MTRPERVIFSYVSIKKEKREPDVFITNSKGNASMHRILPFNLVDTVDRLAIVYHSDHRLYPPVSG